MQKFLFEASKILAKRKWLYYLLNCTWGILMTAIGAIALLIMLPFARPSAFCRMACINVGKKWGGISLGLTFIRDTTSWNVLSCHEYGHSYQNAIFGPFMLFVVTIPSAIRYWYRYFKYDRKGKIPPTAYDDIWFERSATEIGIYAADNVH